MNVMFHVMTVYLLLVLHNTVMYTSGVRRKRATVTIVLEPLCLYAP